MPQTKQIRKTKQKAKGPRYYVTTWDTEKQMFTPQRGVRTGPYSLWGLRKAIRKLRHIGYPCNYTSRCSFSSDPSVSIVKVSS